MRKMFIETFKYVKGNKILQKIQKTRLCKGEKRVIKATNINKSKFF